MRVTIRDITYYLPEKVITNDHLREENPDWDMQTVEARAGVLKRYVVNEGVTALDLAYEACQNLFVLYKDLPAQIDGIIFCTQTADYIMPPNACLLHKKLALPEDVFAFDFTLACSGYIYGLALAQALICAKISKNVILVNADTYSRYIHPRDRSARTLFSDGAAVSWITQSDSSQGIIDIQCATSGKNFEKLFIPAGGCRIPKNSSTSVPMTDENGNVRTLENIHMDGMGILGFVNSRIPQQIRKVLNRNSLTLDQINLFVFHQASKLALDSLTRILNVEKEKVYQNLPQVGNTVSASIPIALKDAWQSGRILKGHKVLLSGFGVGLSWGTALLEF